jgi:O-6-methylguanine DNA methyltransferase
MARAACTARGIFARVIAMEAPWVRCRSKLARIAFEQQPPRLVRWGFHASPFGTLLIGIAADDVLCRIAFACGKTQAALLKEWKREWPRSEFIEDKKTTAKILQKILGRAKGAGDFAVRMTGTLFQQKAWKELLKVPAGTTVSYAELARRIKKPKAARAVGNAMNANPVPILVPCHRVIATGGGLGGFGGGLGLKRQLLEAERRAA